MTLHFISLPRSPSRSILKHPTQLLLQLLQKILTAPRQTFFDIWKKVAPPFRNQRWFSFPRINPHKKFACFFTPMCDYSTRLVVSKIKNILVTHFKTLFAMVVTIAEFVSKNRIAFRVSCPNLLIQIRRRAKKIPFRSSDLPALSDQHTVVGFQRR